MQTSSSVMEHGLKDGIYIDYWQKDDHFLCIRVASVKEISNKVNCVYSFCVLIFKPICIKWTLLPQFFGPTCFLLQGVWLVFIITMF